MKFLRFSLQGRAIDTPAAKLQNWPALADFDDEAPVVPKRVTSGLLVAGVLLPIAISVVLGAARLLAAMDDAAGGAALDRIALALGIVWVVALVATVLVLGANSLGGPPKEPPGSGEPPN